MANEVDLNGSEYIQNIPGIYFDASAGLVEKLGDKQAGAYIARIGTATGGVVDLTINIIKDPDNPGKVIASTIVANTAYIISGLFANVIVEAAIGVTLATLGIATAPVWLTVAGVGAAVGATTYFGSDLKDFVYSDLKNSLSGFEEYGFHSPEVVGTVTKDVFIAQSASNDPNFCKNIFQDYVNYRQITEIKSGSESFLYNQLTKNATISTSTTSEKEAVEIILNKTSAEKLDLNNKTYDIITANTLTPLELRNLIDNIDGESYYDPGISIREETKMDLGEYGVIDMLYNSGGLYGDLYGRHFNTFEDIFTYTGMTVTDLLKLNPWLFDEDNDGNYVSDYQRYDPTVSNFVRPAKLLLPEGTDLSTTNIHTIIGGSDLRFVSFEGSYLDEREVA